MERTGIQRIQRVMVLARRTTTRYRAVPARLVGAMMMRGAAFRDRTTATKVQQRLDGPSVGPHPRSLTAAS